MSRHGRGRLLSVLAFAAAIVATGVLVVAPLYTVVSGDESGTSTHGATLLQVNGAGVLIPLAIPIVLTGVGALVRRRGAQVIGALCTAALLIFTLLALVSIGIFYVPALALAIAATVVRFRGVRRHRFAAPVTPRRGGRTR